MMDKTSSRLKAANRFMARYLTCENEYLKLRKKKPEVLRKENPGFGELVVFVDRDKGAKFDCQLMVDNPAMNQVMGLGDDEDDNLFRRELPCFSCESCRPILLDFCN